MGESESDDQESAERKSGGRGEELARSTSIEAERGRSVSCARPALLTVVPCT